MSDFLTNSIKSTCVLTLSKCIMGIMGDYLVGRIIAQQRLEQAIALFEERIEMLRGDIERIKEIIDALKPIRP